MITIQCVYLAKLNVTDCYFGPCSQSCSPLLHKCQQECEYAEKLNRTRWCDSKAEYMNEGRLK